jgi:hypothetical protein
MYHPKANPDVNKTRPMGRIVPVGWKQPIMGQNYSTACMFLCCMLFRLILQNGNKALIRRHMSFLLTSIMTSNV